MALFAYKDNFLFYRLNKSYFPLINLRLNFSINMWLLHFSWRGKYITRLNLLTSYLLVKVGYLDSNLLIMFGMSNEVHFGWSWACFKATEVSYNFLKNILLQKMHRFFLIPKIPLRGQNYQKWTSSKMIQKWPCIFSSQTPSKLSRFH